MSFNATTEVLFLQPDSPSSNDAVTIKPAGLNNDGSMGVTVTSDLVQGGTQTFGSAGQLQASPRMAFHRRMSEKKEQEKGQ